VADRVRLVTSAPLAASYADTGPPEVARITAPLSVMLGLIGVPPGVLVCQAILPAGVKRTSLEPSAAITPPEGSIIGAEADAEAPSRIELQSCAPVAE
jgi:hypothetical protein